ncbi:MAG TPA: aminotransferase class I/II-fold pyridoxal phosphate-dependent enzyme [Vicinamibacterales bacterium]|nr:aminotransferase class I/II-fold pyridoxal phosphate-dependent enzyme [Vicinamibacterales bacterium]
MELSDLAIFGGAPRFVEPLHVGRPHVVSRAALLERVNVILDRHWLTNDGPYVVEFERELSRRLGVAHCLVTSNATAGLEVLLKACGLTGEVIVPAFTFVATAHAVQWSGLTPVFCDIDRRTHNIDPRDVEAQITTRTTAILATHMWGRACDIDALGAIAGQHRLRLFFDAAHAFGCRYKGRPLGSFGDAEVFSFHATKVVTTFEGGAVTTNQSDLAETVSLMRSFGFADYDQVVSVGTNAKMHEAGAAMGLTSLEAVSGVVDVNRRHHTQYQRELGQLPGVTMIKFDPNDTPNYQYVVAEIDAGHAGIGRDLLQRVLWAENVLARRYFYPGCHRMRPYVRADGCPVRDLPATDDLAAKVLCLPTGTALTSDDIGTVCDIVRYTVEHGHDVTARAERRA